MRRSALLLLLLVFGCTTSPLTGREQFLLVSDSMAVSQSAAAYAQMIGELGKKKQIESGTPRAAKVKEITDKLVKQAVCVRPDAASWNWEVQVINDPKTVNAFCMAGGKMAIYTGMWEQLKATDEEIAQVMGHEIDARAYLYALVVVFYRLASCKLPFKGYTPFAIAHSHVSDPPTPFTFMS